MSTHDNEPDPTEETTEGGWPSPDDAPVPEPSDDQSPPAGSETAKTPAPPVTAAEAASVDPPPAAAAPAPEPAPAPSTHVTPEEAVTGRRVPARPSWAVAGGLIGAALVVGTGIGYAVNDCTGSGVGSPIGLAARADLSGRPDGFGRGGGPSQGGLDDDGRMFGGTRVQGRVSATTDSSITVESSGGTATYTVDSSTRIVVNGQSASLSDVTVGQTVFLLVGRSSSDDDVVRVVLVGSMPQFGQSGQAPPSGGEFPSLNGSTT